MSIERTNFLFIAGALATGAVGGWVYRDHDAGAARMALANATPPASASETTPPGPIAVTVMDARLLAAPVCDDSQGTPEECPTLGPSDESPCANVILKRCQDFKAAFAPKVATQAVTCLRALRHSERCDPARVNQCGHLALMAACPAPTSPLKAQLQNAAGSEAPIVTIALDASAPASLVAGACESILKRCGSNPLNPTLTDCRQTLAGLNEVGRASMVECVSTHCKDRGLYACEAVLKPQAVASVDGNR